MTDPAPRISEDELARLEELAGKATPGPWRSRPGHLADGFMPDGYRYVQFGPTEAEANGLGTDQLAPADADLIAEVINALPGLIAAARSAPAAGLDVAWAEAEAAVPEGYGFGVTKTVAVASGPYVATADYGPVEHGYGDGPTPAAALLALAAALREPKP